MPAILVGWCAVAGGIAAKDGRYGAWALSSVLVGFAAVILAVVVVAGTAGPAADAGTASTAVAVRPRGWFGAWLLVAVMIGVVPLVRRPRYYAVGRFATVADVLAILAGLLAAGSILVMLHRAARGRRIGREPHQGRGRLDVLASPWVFWLVLALACAAGVATIRAVPTPRIDVFHLLQVSTAGLPHGADMYRQQWAPSRAEYPVDGLFDVYPYLPVTSVLLAPFRLLLGDVRYGLLLALAVAAVLIRAVAGAGRAPGGRAPAAPAVAALPLLVVVFPESMYALQQSWTEPLLVACLAATVWASTSGRGRVAVVAFALALATKQHVVLLIPMAAGYPAFGPRRTAAAAVVAALLVAPWVVAGPRDFLDDAVWTNLHYEVLAHSLSLPGLASHFGVTLGFGLTAVALLGAYTAAWRARGDATGFCLGAALVLLTLNLMNKQTFFNHYTLPMGLLVLAVAALAVDDPARAGGQRSVENRSSDAPSYRLRRSTCTVRSRSVASWSDSTAQAPSRNR